MKGSFAYTLVAIIAAIFFSSCENTQEEIDRLNKKMLMVDQATRVESYLSQDGKTKARLTAPLMLRVTADTSYTEFPKSLHVDFYNDANIVETRLDSKYGKYYENLNKVYLRDSVVVISTNGDSLYCQDLWWDQNTELFFTDLPAQQRSPGQRIDGRNGLEATQDLKRITFKNVQGTVPTKEGDIPG